MQVTCCFYPHLARDCLVAPLTHPQTGLYPPLRHPLHPGADEVHGRTAVVADGLVERAQSCTDLSLLDVRESRDRYVGDQNFGVSLMLRSYLLCVGARPLVPRRGTLAPSKRRGTKVLDLAEVGQYGAGGTIHPVKGIAEV